MWPKKTNSPKDVSEQIKKDIRSKLKGLTVKEVWEVMNDVDFILDDIEEEIEDKRMDEIYK